MLAIMATEHDVDPTDVARRPALPRAIPAHGDLKPLSISAFGHPTGTGTDRILDALVFELFAVWDIRGVRSVSRSDFRIVQSIVGTLTGHSAHSGLSADACRVISGCIIGLERRRRRSRSVPGRRSAGPPAPLPRAIPRPESGDLPRYGVLFTAPRTPDPPRRSPSRAAQSPSPVARSVSKPSSRRGSEQLAPAESRSRVPFLEGLGLITFADVDLDGDGSIDADEFRSWIMRALDASQMNRAAQHHWVAWLVQHLGSCMKFEPRIIAMRALLKQLKIAAELKDKGALVKSVDTLMRAVVAAECRLDVDDDPLPMCRSQGAALQQELRDQVFGALEGAKALAALGAALEEARIAAPLLALPDGELQPYAQRLDAWNKPFTIHVSTIAGVEATVEAFRVDKVGDLRESVAAELGEKAYRVMLSNESLRLEPDTATLEECGVCSCEGEELVAVFGERDRWKEMSAEEFVEFAVSVKVLSSAQADQIRRDIVRGELTLDKLLSTYVGRVTAAEAAEIRKKEAEEKAEAKKLQRIAEEKAREEKKRQEIAARVDAVVAGQQKLAESASDEQLLEQLRLLGSAATLGELDAKSKHLVAEVVSYAAMSRQLAIKTAEAEAELSQRVADAMRTKEEAQAELDTVLPVLDSCFKLLHSLRKQDVCEAQIFVNPPRGMRKVAKALCIMFRIRPLMQVQPGGDGTPTRNYWDACRRDLFRSHRFSMMLMEYDKDNISQHTIRGIQHFIDDPEFTRDELQKQSLLGAACCVWVRAMYTYYHVAQGVAPLKAVLKRLETDIERLMCWQNALGERMRLTEQKAASCREALNEALQQSLASPSAH